MMSVIFLISFIFSLCFVVGLDIIISRYLKNKPKLDNVERFVDISLDISEQLNHFMYKYNIDTKEFCKKLNISNDTLLVWLSGIYDFKISQLTRIESVFNEHIIKTTLLPRKKIKPI
jgi:hypothetical protein